VSELDAPSENAKVDAVVIATATMLLAAELIWLSLLALWFARLW
jgi:hypothetical protein